MLTGQVSHIKQYLFHQSSHMEMYNVLSLDPRFKLGKNKNLLTGKKKKKMEETTGRATEEGSLSQDGQTRNRCRMWRTD